MLLNVETVQRGNHGCVLHLWRRTDVLWRDLKMAKLSYISTVDLLQFQKQKKKKNTPGLVRPINGGKITGIRESSARRDREAGRLPNDRWGQTLEAGMPVYWEANRVQCTDGLCKKTILHIHTTHPPHSIAALVPIFYTSARRIKKGQVLVLGLFRAYKREEGSWRGKKGAGSLHSAWKKR